MFRRDGRDLRPANTLDSAPVGTILEVEPVDPLLEVSSLTDDSKMFQSLAMPLKKGERKSRLASAAPSTRVVSGYKPSVLSRFETPKKLRRAFTRATASTPETAPMDDDSDGFDEISDDSKFLRHIESEVTVRLDDYREVTFRKLIDRLSGNVEVSEVEVYRLSRICNQRRRTDEEMNAFFDALQSLPNLKKLALKCFSPFDLELIISLIKNHKTLEKLHIHLVSGTVDSCLLENLAESTALREVSLDVQCSFPLHLLLASRSLTHVRVPSERFRFDEGQLVFAMNALEKNRTLKVLDLKPKMNPSDVRLLSFGIRRNSELKILRFSFLADETDSGPALLHFVKALAQNSGLQTVQNHYGELLRLASTDAFRLRRLVENHPTLVDFAIFEPERSEKVTEDDMFPEEESASFLSRMMCNTELSFCRVPDSVTSLFHNTTPDGEESNLKKLSVCIVQIHGQLRKSFAKLLPFREEAPEPQYQ